MIALNPQKFTMMSSFRNWINYGSIDDVGRLMRADADNMGKFVLANSQDVEHLSEIGLFTKKDRPMYEITMKRSRWANEEVLQEACSNAMSTLTPCMTMEGEGHELLSDAITNFFYEMYCYEVTIVIKKLTDGGVVETLGTMERKIYNASEYGLESMILDAYDKYDDA